MKKGIILALAKNLIALRSVSGNREELEAALNLVLGELLGFSIEHFERNGVKSVLIHNKTIGTRQFRIILNGHLDIIPAKDDQFVPRIENGRLYGAGSMDMKANLACLVYVFRDIAKRVSYPLGLQIVTDEEIGGFDGTKYQIDCGVKADFVIASEPTNFDIVNEAKGILQVKISFYGKSAHGAYPWRGVNALWKMNDFLNALKKRYPIPREESWITTMNLSRIETSNVAFNKIPDECVAWIDTRFVPGEKKSFLAELRCLLPEECSMEEFVHESAVATDKCNEYIQTLSAVGMQILGKKLDIRGAHGSSDARHFAAVGCPGIEFGPIGGGIGSDDEWVDIKSIKQYYKLMKKFLVEL